MGRPRCQARRAALAASDCRVSSKSDGLKTDAPSDSKPPPPVTSKVSLTPLAFGGAAMRLEVAF